jgi:hypothetical protein
MNNASQALVIGLLSCGNLVTSIKRPVHGASLESLEAVLVDLQRSDL